MAGGADIDSQDSRGYTPLHYAVYGGLNELASLMIKRGAKVDPMVIKGYYYISVKR